MENCLFCKIVEGKIPSTKVYEDEHVYAFKDIHAQAKIHYLFVHKRHSHDVMDLMQEKSQLIDIFSGIGQLVQKENLHQSGFRLVNNCGALAGQTVFHTHFHLLSGEELGAFGARR